MSNLSDKQRSVTQSGLYNSLLIDSPPCKSSLYHNLLSVGETKHNTILKL